ncbi:hypothetical protein [Clostridium tyrobutyricum]|uniref:hypothetical protein n=1 Tax=Clostridium tyrobutyricum TaxID=1519 RepID=UPI00057E64F8|nr:hypothetical protein [Clostridium tyrobutyricum]
MSDTVIALIIICITSLGLTAMVIVGTYFKDKLTIKGKSSVGKLSENEISITAEEKNSKN